MINVDLQQLVQALDAATKYDLECAAERCVVRGGSKILVEDLLLDVMYEIPSRSDVQKCVVSAETGLNRQRPLLLTAAGRAVEFEGIRPDQAQSA